MRYSCVSSGNLAFVFPGQGSQIVGMAGRSTSSRRAARRSRRRPTPSDSSCRRSVRGPVAGPRQHDGGSAAILTTSVAILEASIESVNAKLGPQVQRGVGHVVSASPRSIGGSLDRRLSRVTPSADRRAAAGRASDRAVGLAEERARSAALQDRDLARSGEAIGCDAAEARHHVARPLAGPAASFASPTR